MLSADVMGCTAPQNGHVEKVTLICRLQLTHIFCWIWIPAVLDVAENGDPQFVQKVASSVFMEPQFKHWNGILFSLKMILFVYTSLLLNKFKLSRMIF